MGEVSTIGLDIAKSVFQIHGVDAGGAVVIRKRITRAKLLEFFAALPPCLVGIEACPTAHYWSRRLQALGHTVRLLPPSYVKAYLKRSKNDANDAAAICEAVTRPSMRFVATKSEQQQCSGTQRPCRQSSDMSSNEGRPAVPSRCREFSLWTQLCHLTINFAMMHSSVLAQRCSIIGREGPFRMLIPEHVWLPARFISYGERTMPNG
jgi:Transposase